MKNGNILGKGLLVETSQGRVVCENVLPLPWMDYFKVLCAIISNSAFVVLMNYEENGNKMPRTN